MRSCIVLVLLLTLVGCSQKAHDSSIPLKPVNKGSKVETDQGPGAPTLTTPTVNVPPRKAEEVVATMKSEDVDKALACLKANKIEAKTVNDRGFTLILVKREETKAADKLLSADAAAKQYNIHANASGVIRPSP